MSRKDYELLAAAFRRAFAEALPSSRLGVSIALAEVAKALAADNLRFDPGRFMSASQSTTEHQSATL